MKTLLNTASQLLQAQRLPKGISQGNLGRRRGVSIYKLKSQSKHSVIEQIQRSKKNVCDGASLCGAGLCGAGLCGAGYSYLGIPEEAYYGRMAATGEGHTCVPGDEKGHRESRCERETTETSTKKPQLQRGLPARRLWSNTQPLPWPIIPAG